MNDAVRMRVTYGFAYGCERPEAVGEVGLGLRRPGMPAHELHRVVRQSLLQSPRVVNGHDAGVFESSGDRGLGGEPLSGGMGGVRSEHLEGDVTAQQRVVCVFDQSHASAPDRYAVAISASRSQRR